MSQDKSINIGGIIFYIKDDAFDKLNGYRLAIVKRFSGYQNSQNIISDIENRMAEILLSRITSNHPSITLEDIKALIQEIGSTSDSHESNAENPQDESSEKKYFQDIEDIIHEIEDITEELKDIDVDESYSSKSTFTFDTEEHKQSLFRDNKRKMVGGLCAGLAHYFKIDPLWIRLGIALPVFYLYDHITLCFTIAGLYLLACLLIPQSNDLEPNDKTKVFFRDSDELMLGGIASGLSKHLGINIIYVRLIFVGTAIIPYFNFIGLFSYIALWLFTPKARSINDKIQSSGKKITLDNIETYLKEQLSRFDSEEHSELKEGGKKIFRKAKSGFKNFRLEFSHLLDKDNPFMKIIKALAIFVGLNITFGSVILIICLGFLMAIGWGVFSIENVLSTIDITLNDVEVFEYDIILAQAIQDTIPFKIVLFAGLSLLIPQLYITGIGICMMTWKWFLNKKVTIVSWLAWIVSFIGLAVSVALFQLNYNTEGSYQEAFTLPVKSNKLNINTKLLGVNEFSKITLDVKGHQDKDIKVVYQFTSKGKTRQNAITNARTVVYDMEYEEEDLVLDSHFKFVKETPYRVQDLKVTVFVPYHLAFTLNDISFTLLDRIENPILQDMNSFDGAWVFLPNNQVHQWDLSAMPDIEVVDLNPNITIPPMPDIEIIDVAPNVQVKPSKKAKHALPRKYKIKMLKLPSFNEVVIKGNLNIKILEGDKTFIRMPEDINKFVEINVIDNVLIIKPSAAHQGMNFDEEIVITTTEDLEQLIMKGRGELNVHANNSPQVEVILEGFIDADLNINTEAFFLYADKHSDIKVKGNSNVMKIKLDGHSSVNAKSFKVQDIIVKSAGASEAQVYAEKRAEVFSSPSSEVIVEGNATVIRN